MTCSAGIGSALGLLRKQNAFSSLWQWDRCLSNPHNWRSAGISPTNPFNIAVLWRERERGGGGRERESCKVLQLLPKNKINEKDDLLLTMTHVNRSSLEQSRPVLYYYEGRFTSWTMKLDHGRWPFSVVPFFIKKSNYKAFGPLKPSVDQETMYPKMNMLIQKKCICPQKWHFW